MTEYLVTFAAAAKKELQDLPADVIERLLPKIRELSGSPRPAGCKKLHGYKNRWRVRVGNYRIVYAIDDEKRTVDITRIAHRKEVYE
ncbi:MAG TPA: type II toxin-antitoxin system RelE/ParE family toxin [Candidatus Solibacter sp.]|nr:type II toxin-antitoxin system RelE/ParE family toxin [Candidatus Solibacter sp.]